MTKRTIGRQIDRLAREVGRSAVRAILLLVALAVVAGSFAFLLNAFKDGKVDQGVIALLILGLATLIVVEVLPTLQSLKFGTGGVEFSFRDLGEKVTLEADDLKKRVADLERLVKARATPARKNAAETTEIPEALLRRGKYRDDPRKGVFGGASSVGDYELTADFDDSGDKAWTDVTLTVHAKGEAVGKAAGAYIFLHDSFKSWRVYVPFDSAGKADICRTIWGGFTVGAWVPGADVMLELDLAELPYAPKIVKEL